MDKREGASFDFVLVCDFVIVFVVWLGRCKVCHDDWLQSTFIVLQFSQRYFSQHLKSNFVFVVCVHDIKSS